MSSHLLTDEEFQKIADWLYTQAIMRGSIHWHDTRDFIGLQFGTAEHYEAKDERVKELVTCCVRNYYNLNRLALVVRYGDNYDRKDEKQFVPKELHDTVSEKEVIRLMRSLHYQTAEYLVSTTEFHKKLNDFIGEICQNRIFAE